MSTSETCCKVLGKSSPTSTYEPSKDASVVVGGARGNASVDETGKLLDSVDIFCVTNCRLGLWSALPARMGYAVVK